MPEKIYIPQPIAKEGEIFLLERGYEIVPMKRSLAPEDMKEDLQECQAMILRTAKVDREILQAAPKLKIVARHGAGFDNLDVNAAAQLGIWATYSPDTTTAAVAEYTISAMLLLEKKLIRADSSLRKNNFNDKLGCRGSELGGKTLGIIGLGRIGKETARKAVFGFQMKVLAYVPRPQGKEIPAYVKPVEWEKLFEDSDFIALHVPGGEQNHRLIGRTEFARMKQGAFLINPSRGGVVDEHAFAEAVAKGRIGGGALDVFETEPPQLQQRLLHLENVLLTPHIASNTAECMERIAMDVAGDVHLVLSGEQPRHPINGMIPKILK